MSERAQTTYTTLSGLTVYKGETREEAEARVAQFNLWRGVYGSPEYGGWGLDPADNVRKPVPEFKAALEEREQFLRVHMHELKGMQR
jgi:hypothetical protein